MPSVVETESPPPPPREKALIELAAASEAAVVTAAQEVAYTTATMEILTTTSTVPPPAPEVPGERPPFIPLANPAGVGDDEWGLGGGYLAPSAAAVLEGY